MKTRACADGEPGVIAEPVEFSGGFVYYKVYIKRTMAVSLHGGRNAAGSTEGD